MIAFPVDNVQNVSESQSGVVGNRYSISPSVSGSGQYVAFQSAADNLAGTDANPWDDIFVKNLDTGGVVLASCNASNEQANDFCRKPSISADGTKVAFESYATNLVPGADVSNGGLFVKNLTDGTIAFIAPNAGEAKISADGNYVTFTSWEALAPGDSDGSLSIYRAATNGSSIELVSEHIAATPDTDGWHSAIYSAISGDGNYVAFVSDYTDLTADDTNGVSDLFVKNMTTGTAERVAPIWDEAFAGMYSGTNQRAAISADGRKVVFTSYASDLLPGVSGGAIFWKDLDTGDIKLVATGIGGLDLSQFELAISADGNKVSFASFASDLVAGDTNNAIDVFVKDMTSGEVQRVSHAQDGSELNAASYDAAISGDGSTVVFTSWSENIGGDDGNAQVDVFSAQPHFVGSAYAPTTPPLAPQDNDLQLVSQTGGGIHGNSYSIDGTISGNGRYVAFRSYADNLTPDDNNQMDDILVKDLQTGNVVVASTNAAGDQADYTCENPSISDDGQRVAFESFAWNLVDGAYTDYGALYVKDLVDQSVSYIAPAAHNSEIAGNGRYVAFNSDWDQTLNDSNGVSDVYVATADGLSLQLASANADGEAGNANSQYCSISDNGRYVAFISNATNLVDADNNEVADVFVKDMLLGTVQRVAPLLDGSYAGAGVDAAASLQISGDGRHVTFYGYASGLVDGVSGGALYWADLDTGDIRLVADGEYGVAGGLAALGGDNQPAMSADGRYVAFGSYASELVDGDTNNALDVFVKDMVTGEIKRASVPEDGGEANAYSCSPSISSDGRTVVFGSFASNLADDDTNGVPDVFAADSGFAGAAENRAPVVEALSLAIPEDTTASGDLLMASYDPDGDALALVDASDTITTTGGRELALGVDYIVAEDGYAALTAEGAQKFNSLADGATDTAVLEYGVSDGTEVTSSTVTLTVVGSNDATTGATIDVSSIAENAEAGTLVGTLAAVDPDLGDAHSFTLIDDASGRFYIDGNTLRVAAGANLNFEGPATSYDVIVRASDLAGTWADQTLTIALTNVNEAPDGLLPVVATVVENSAGGTLVCELTGHDPDSGDTLSYSLTDSAEGRFEIIGNKLRVAAGAEIDYETATTHQVTVEVTDAGGLTYQQTLTINVTNVSGHIIGTNAANVLNGTSEEDTIEGLGGNDTLNGGAGVDTLIGGSGNDTYILDDGNIDTIVEISGGGSDTVILGAGYADPEYHLGTDVENLTAQGGSGVALFGNELANRLTGNSGDNLLDGGAGADTMTGGAGDDTYVVDDAGDRITELGGGGTDEVQSVLDTYSLASLGNVENLTYLGHGAFNGTGNSQANVIIGGDGADTLDGKSGADTLIGLDGDDTYIVDNAGDQVIETADGGDDTVRSSISYTLGADVENLVLTGSSSLSGTGNSLANHITGNNGSNVLDGGLGYDVLTGGLGNDTYVINEVGDSIVEVSGQGTDLVRTTLASFSLDGIANVENLTFAGTGNFTGTGNELANTIIGGEGSDTLVGGLGGDTMRGGTGDDTYYVDASNDRITENTGEGTDLVYSSVNLTLGSNLENLTLTGTATTGTGNGLANVITGNASNNTLSGGSGNDTLIGGGGNDTMTGGSGTDTFVFTLGFGHDIVKDFTATGASHDVLEFDHSIFEDLADVLSHAQQATSTTVVITADSGDSITLQNTKLNKLTTDNVDFV